MVDNQPKNLVGQFEAALLTMDRLTARRLLTEQGGEISPTELIEHVVVPALERVGANWEKGRLALSQVYMSGRICEELIDSLIPIGKEKLREQPKIAIVTLEDFHLLGKRLVYSTLRASGYIVHDFGRQEVASLVPLVINEQVEMLLISVLMLPSALRVAELRKTLEQEGRCPKIIVGGAPFRFDRNLWREVGADAMGASASEVVSIIQSITGGQKCLKQ